MCGLARPYYMSWSRMKRIYLVLLVHDSYMRFKGRIARKFLIANGANVRLFTMHSLLVQNERISSNKSFRAFVAAKTFELVVNRSYVQL